MKIKIEIDREDISNPQKGFIRDWREFECDEYFVKGSEQGELIVFRSKEMDRVFPMCRVREIQITD